MLKREKEKNISLASQASQITIKNKEINEVLGKILEENRQEGSTQQL